MNRFVILILTALIVYFSLICYITTAAQANTSVSPSVVISQFQVKAPATEKLIEPNNNAESADSVDLNANHIAYWLINETNDGSFEAPFVVAADDPLILGNPSNAVSNINQPTNYLMVKPQYSLSYNRDQGTPNWVAWRLDSSWLGSAPRQNDFRPDPQLPAAWYHVTSGDYSGSGYTRGHMTSSGDRTRSIADNSATFLMTNFVPQTAANNNGTWNEEENYLRGLAQSGNEIYTFSGGIGTRGTIANGRVNVPASTWKIALVLPNGSNDLTRINKATRVIAVIVPNTDNVVLNWRQYRVSVDQIEALTGYDFFSKVPQTVQQVIEARVDNQ